ncbi:MAG: phosphoheptose isomerase [Thiobacillus sp.]|nr:phosphoheptose isomerase [Gammaproteobacteria bacterium]MDO9009597.1 phosphoheptose isomerase [Thiobacillus sp.]MDP1924683.1 phosphoheptose isomerase [Thiobacillus sp.]MDP3126100.1 phosphoheptose isomerase [Thiobacillus sp.]OGU20670.1 MAG: phosphoheptose isomerase [Hydrogenophilales bacterium RIFOXYD1_FULL_62_11]
MALHDRILSHFQLSAQTILDTAEGLAPSIEQAARLMVHSLTQGGKIMACGNGGSAADAQRFVAQMVHRFEQERPGLAAIALTTDSSTLTSIANDTAYDQVFARQVKVLGQPGDILLAISTSGNSPSVLQAVDAAHTRSVHVIALSGRSGGQLTEHLVEDDVLLCAFAESAARIQEIHLLTIHCLCDAVDSVLLGVEE